MEISNLVTNATRNNDEEKFVIAPSNLKLNKRFLYKTIAKPVCTVLHLFIVN